MKSVIQVYDIDTNELLMEEDVDVNDMEEAEEKAIEIMENAEFEHGTVYWEIS